MFKAMKEADSYGNKQTHYYLTKGDSCKITATPQRNGSAVADEVKECRFKLASTNYQMLTTPSVFPIKMERLEDSDGFVLNLTSTISEQIPVGKYIYEIEYVMNDDSVQTPHSWNFDILPEITNS